MIDALVIGAGPAGLMAAEALAKAGRQVVVVEAKPSVGRKFLMAGKSGLNLTKDEPFDAFMRSYGAAEGALAPMLTAFGPTEIRTWAEDLGQEIFVGSSKRVFPKAMKASPLLRAWLRRLADLGVEVRAKWRWVGGFEFDTPDGKIVLSPNVTVLACGGASWSKLGSDGAWATGMDADVLAPFQPVNMGFVVAWSDHMQKHFGAPIKNVVLRAGDISSKAEFMISNQGIEGGGIYDVSRAMRDGAGLWIDLLPNMKLAEIRARLARAGTKESIANRLRKRLKLSPQKQALLMEFARPLPDDLASAIKNLPISHQGPRPIDQAISTSGGIRFDTLDEHLMLRGQPGVFAAGEMLDWDAPTGGYLLSACFATGKWAGQHAAQWNATK